MTTTEYGYNQAWINTAPAGPVFVFSVRACSDVHLALAEFASVEDNAAYQVVIGGWDNSKYVVLKMSFTDDDLIM